MYSEGAAGTGKSRIIEAITDYFSRLKKTHLLEIVAPTGAAAKGSTIHRALKKQRRSKKSKTNDTTLFDKWIQKKFIIIDECSLVSKKLLDELDDVLRRIKGIDSLIQ